MKKAGCFFVAFIFVLTCSVLQSRRIKLSTHPQSVRHSIADALQIIENPDSTLLNFSGYDKPANTNCETFFVSNLGEAGTLRKIEIKIDYRTLDKRMLHSRVVTVKCDVPPKQTRIVEVRSWDKQNSFRYYRSREGRNNATPYDAHITLLKCWYSN